MFRFAVFRSRETQRRAVAIVFVLLVVCLGWNVPAYDLRASYVAGRLMSTGETAHIYDQVGRDSAHDAGSPWAKAAIDGGITDRVVTPYVQGPLWAAFVAPLAHWLRFAAFMRVFLVLTASAAVALVFSATRQWTPALVSPLSQGAVLGALFLTVPFFAGVELGQTNFLFLYIVTQAIIAEQRGRSLVAGLLLAFGAYTKITPMWIAVTWVARGNWRAGASFAAFSVCLQLAALAVGGWSNLVLYARVLKKAGQFVLLTYNNESFHTLFLQSNLDPRTIFSFQAVPLPIWLSCAAFLATMAAAISMGLYERNRDGRQVGPIFTLVAATMFTPLAWNHYFVLLVLPVILFVDYARQHGKMQWMLLAGVVLVLNLPPLSYLTGSSLWIVSLRSQFWAAALCLLSVPYLLEKQFFFEKKNQKTFASLARVAG